jgi:DMSO/TMAO reductase YedYZ molybdopterin-dependent catalytic subunit
MSDVDREVRRLTRRGFLVGGGAGLVGFAAWTLIRSRAEEDGLAWPLRRILRFDESVARTYFSRSHLAKTFDPSKIVRPARINGGLGLDAKYMANPWSLTIEGAASPVTLTLDQLRAMPKREQITELCCIEGWSIVTKWGGVRLADVMARFPPKNPRIRYVGLETPDHGYYVGLDLDSALHPQTLLAYELNGEPLTWQHGAPLRLAIPVKYGIKNIKRIGTIRYSDVRPADYWAEQGYDWYAGL